jgi:hypothetical protein
VINPRDRDTLQHCIDTCFVLLNTSESIQLPFWQESFHSVRCSQPQPSEF